MENDSEPTWPTAGSSESDIPPSPISPKQYSRRVENPSTDTIDSGPNIINEPRRYNIRKGKEGLFVIFNHEIFDDTDLPLRKGTDTDKIGLQEVWEELGFNVVVHEDLKYTQICEKIKKYSSNDYHNDYDCFALAVLTHGGDKDVIHAKDKPYHANELFEPFRDCTSLTGKPKLFFIQACRGQELDHGKRLECDAVDAAVTPPDDNVEVTIPRESDFLIAYSTVEGYYSWRNQTDGSWFIGKLNKCMKIYTPKWDLMTILTEVNREVSTRESASDLKRFKGKKQCPSIVSRLTGLVYFTPQNKSEQSVTDCRQEAAMNPPLLTSESSVFERKNSGSTQNEYYRLKMEVLGKKKELIELEQNLCQAKMQKVKFDC